VDLEPPQLPSSSSSSSSSPSKAQQQQCSDKEISYAVTTSMNKYGTIARPRHPHPHHHHHPRTLSSVTTTQESLSTIINQNYSNSVNNLSSSTAVNRDHYSYQEVEEDGDTKSEDLEPELHIAPPVISSNSSIISSFISINSNNSNNNNNSNKISIMNNNNQQANNNNNNNTNSSINNSSIDSNDDDNSSQRSLHKLLQSPVDISTSRFDQKQQYYRSTPPSIRKTKKGSSLYTLLEEAPSSSSSPSRTMTKAISSSAAAASAIMNDNDKYQHHVTAPAVNIISDDNQDQHHHHFSHDNDIVRRSFVHSSLSEGHLSSYDTIIPPSHLTAISHPKAFPMTSSSSITQSSLFDQLKDNNNNTSSAMVDAKTNLLPLLLNMGISKVEAVAVIHYITHIKVTQDQKTEGKKRSSSLAMVI